MKNWQKNIIDNYIEDFENYVKNKSNNKDFTERYNFNENEINYLNKKIDLNLLTNSDTPLLSLVSENKIELISHIILSNEFIDYNINEKLGKQTLLTSITEINFNEEITKKSFSVYCELISDMFFADYKISELDRTYIKSKKDEINPKKRLLIMFVSYALKLNEPNEIMELYRKYEIIASFACLKHNINIGFYNSIEELILESTHLNNAYQNELIKYIEYGKLNHFDSLKNKLIEQRSHISQRIEKPILKTIIHKLFY
ncbi:hypothetical protein [Psychroflexus salis]|uniref:Uncharacterized protein n=1 Tax=Psychroflexus salis TaxID=1526574 RepID=A0A916ZWX8_9FLAO|nr:hypothetical protein [Psychroflexus salis]GGE15489.1 hypothetical protein GCM10010831_16000 [Psychroflexus salis]